jgi:hypothetical protein
MHILPKHKHLIHTLVCPQFGYEMRVNAIITDHGECKHSLEVNKVLACLKRNNAPLFDKNFTSAS